MKYVYYLVDVFSAHLFGGNQLAVFPRAEGLSDQQMQQIAREFNFSETCFVLPPKRPEHSARVRIFTPLAEIPFAGHPTLGSAWVIRHHLGLTATELVLEENVGSVPVRFEAEMLELETAQLPEFQTLEISKAVLADLLGIPPEAIARDLPIEQVSCGAPYCVVPINSLVAIQAARFCWHSQDPRLQTWPILGRVYLVCTETQNPDADFHVRLFAPLVGVSEDPATGSAAAVLGAYLWKHQAPTGGSWQIEQGQELGRPSQLWVRVISENASPRIFVKGEVCLFASGQLELP